MEHKNVRTLLRVGLVSVCEHPSCWLDPAWITVLTLCWDSGSGVKLSCSLGSLLRADHEPTMCLCRDTANSIWGCISKSAASRLWQVILALYSAWVKHIWSSESSSETPSTRGSGTYWNKSNGGQWRWLKDCSVSLKGEADRDGTVQPQEEKAAQRALSICINVWLWGVMEKETDSSLWSPTEGKESMATIK